MWQLGAFPVACGLSKEAKAWGGGWQMTLAFLFNTRHLQQCPYWLCQADKEDIEFVFLVFGNRQAFIFWVFTPHANNCCYFYRNHANAFISNAIASTIVGTSW